MADKYEDDISGSPVVQPTIGPITSYTVSPAGSGTATGTTTATYQQIGPLAHIVINFTATAAGSGTSDITFALPAGLTQASGPTPNGAGQYKNASNVVVPGTSIVVGGLIYLRIPSQFNLRGQDLGNGSFIHLDIYVPIVEYATTAYTAYGAGQATATKLGLVMGGTVPGSTSATTPTAGYIGEKVSATVSTSVGPGASALDTYLDFAGWTTTIPSAGEWRITLNGSIGGVPGGTGFVIYNAAIRDASNNVLAAVSIGTASANSTNTMPTGCYGGGSCSVTVVTTGSLVIKGSVRVSIGGTTPTLGSLALRGDIAPALIEATRIG